MNYFDNIGDPLDRVEGILKVTGKATYAAEYNIPQTAYGVLVTSTIAKGRIISMDTKKAENAPGVLSIISHLNRPDVPGYTTPKEKPRVPGQEFRLLFDDRIYHNQQPIAIAVAETSEQAEYAASLVEVTYEEEPHQTDLEANLEKGIKAPESEDYSRGRADSWDSAPVRFKNTYKTAIQVHNPMETHSATANWDKNGLVTNYNKTQTVIMAKQDIVTAFNLPEKNINVYSPFVGGAFGSSSRVWPPEMAALLAANKLKRPVRVVARRDQVFNMVGYRPASVQKFTIGASRDGTLRGISHEAFGGTSSYEIFEERIIDPTRTLYKCPAINTQYKVVPLDMSTPCWTRGPGETSGSFALESAMDELSYQLKMDPLALRLKNFAEKDPESGKPWSSNFLKDCYEKGSQKFGWSKRNPMPGSMKKDGMLLGMGMSAGIYKANRSAAPARALLQADGVLVVHSSVADVGPGSATIMTQIAADVMGLKMQQVKLVWGNSTLPPAPGQFGSHTTASVGSAIYDVCEALKKRVFELAVNSTNSKFKNRDLKDLEISDGMVVSKTNANNQISLTELLKGNHLSVLETSIESKPGPEAEKYSSKSFCANFVEVLVHPLTGTVKISRVVSAVDAGRIINHKTANSQVLGSVVWGIGLALMEDAHIDHRYGRHINKDLSEYHVPVNADIPDIEVILIDKPDPYINPIGAKGIGEIPLVGFTAAVANAVYHATGKRIRNLPITPSKLII